MSIDRTTAERYAAWFACLADPTRIQILNALASDERPMTVTELVAATDVSQPTVSHHIKMLANSRFVLVARRGAATHCALNKRCLEQFPAAARAVLGITVSRSIASRNERRSAAPTFRRATAGDLAEVETLVRAEGLPFEGMRENLPETWVAEAEGGIQACAAVEFHGGSALLRSVAVARDRRRQGLGRQIVEVTLNAAADRAERAYLLTEGATAFFARLGFRRVARDRVPTKIRGSAEFALLCPITAQAMTRAIQQS
jgi:N-acetylglutamate synthase-like GNAT family acetyltransferase